MDYNAKKTGSEIKHEFDEVAWKAQDEAIITKARLDRVKDTAVDKTKSGFQHAKEVTMEKAHELADKTKAGFQHAKEVTIEKAHELANKTKAGMEYISEYAQDKYHRAAEWVSEKAASQAQPVQ